MSRVGTTPIEPSDWRMATRLFPLDRPGFLPRSKLSLRLVTIVFAVVAVLNIIGCIPWPFVGFSAS